MTESPVFSFSRVCWGVVWLGCLVGLAFSWLGLLGDRHWAFDLVSHFRWQYLAVAVVVMLIAVGRRAWLMAVAGLATVVLNVWLIFGFVEETGEPDEADPGLKVMCLNLLVGNTNVDGVLAEVSRIDPDILILVEVSADWSQALEPLTKQFPHAKFRAKSFYGVAALSRHELRSLETLTLPGSAFPIVEAELEWHGRRMKIIGAHPVPPMSGTAHRNWVNHLRVLGHHVAASEVPCVLGGDLNATPWCHGMRQLLRHSDLGFRLADSAAPWYAAYPTWAVGAPFGIHIDHILCTPELVLDQYEVGEDVGSDHRAVVARVRWVK